MLVEEELSRSVPEGDTALTIGVLDGGSFRSPGSYY